MSPSRPCCAGARASRASPAPGLASPRACTSKNASRRSSKWRRTSASEADEEPADADAADDLVQEWMDTVGKGVPGYVTPEGGRGCGRGQRQRRAPPDSAGGLGDLALPDRLVRCRATRPPRWWSRRWKRRPASRWSRCASSPSSTGCASASPGCRSTRSCSTAAPPGARWHPHPLECRDVGWFTRDTMPSPIVGSERWADTVFAALAGEHRDVLYDSVRQPMWRGDSQKI